MAQPRAGVVKSWRRGTIQKLFDSNTLRNSASISSEVRVSIVGVGTTAPAGGSILDVNGTGVNHSSLIVPRAQDQSGIRALSFSFSEEIVGKNEQLQYMGVIAYDSLILGDKGSIKIEVGLRERVRLTQKKSERHFQDASLWGSF